DDDRREAEAQFVAHEQLWTRHECPADGAHLLLASGKGASRYVAAGREDGEQLINALERPTPGTSVGSDQDVLLHGQGRKELPAFGHERNSTPGDLEGTQSANIVPRELDPP